MTFDDILAQVIALLKRQGRVSYPALKIRFSLDDEYLEAIKAEIEARDDEKYRRELDERAEALAAREAAVAERHQNAVFLEQKAASDRQTAEALAARAA